MTISGEYEAGAYRRLTLGWALKRTILGIVILTVVIGGAAWLTYATIDPDEVAASPSVSNLK